MLRIKIFSFLFILVSNTLIAQNTEMLIEQIAGKTITRENYNNAQELESKQEFIAGKLLRFGSNIIVNMKINLFDKKHVLTSSYNTTYSCQPAASSVLVSVFSVKPRKQKVAVSVISGEFKNLYGTSAGDIPKTISLKMNVETGIFNFLGSKNYVLIDNRTKMIVNNQIIIKSSIMIKAYLMGIKFKTINYNLTEYLSRTGELQKQIFKESDGSYFIMEY